MGLLDRWSRREVVAAREPDPDPEVHGAPISWTEAVARLDLDVHAEVARVLEAAAGELGDAARVEAWESEAGTTLGLSPRAPEAAAIVVLAYPGDATLFVGIDDAWMTWDEFDDPREAIEALREQVHAVVHGQVSIRRCLAGDRWRDGFDLFETREGKEVRSYSNRYVGDLWWWGTRVRTRYAPYRSPRP